MGQREGSMSTSRAASGRSRFGEQPESGGPPPSGPWSPSMLELAGGWQALLAVAAAMFIIGLILLAWPHASIAVVAVLIGIALLVTGVARLVQGLTAGEESGAKRVAYVVIGILAGLAGLYCLRHIDVTAAILGFIVGLFWVMHGVVDLAVAATAGPREGRGLIAVTGVLSLIAGLIVMFWPSESLTVVVVVIGIWLAFDGVLLAFTAFQLRKLAQSGTPPG
jgi:uncharacterized membrane protein HdeD (DUF308 family)